MIFHTSENDVPDGMNPLLLSMSVEREIKQRLMENCNCQEFIYMGNTILIMELHSEDEIAQLTDKCDRFCRWAWRIMGAAVTAGVGTVCNNLYDISSVSTKMLKKLDKKVDLKVIAEQDSVDTRIKTFVKKYAALSGKVKVEWVDSVLHPSVLQKYNTDGNVIDVS